MKKLLALLLAAVMVLTLCACGAKPDEPAAAPEAPAAPDAAAPAADGAYTGDPLNIIFSCTFQETATGGELVTYFKKQVEELSGGAITVNVAYGGTLFGDADQLDGVATGAVNMIALGHNPHAAKLPLLCSVPDFAPDSVQNALDYFNNLLFINPDSSAVLQAEAERNGIKYLSVLAGGANAFVASIPFEDLTSLVENSSAFGNMEAAKFSALGFTVEAVLPWDLYQSFSTGLIDASQMASTSMLQDGVAEVATYWMYDNTYTAGNFLTVNLEWWNGLSAEQQEVLQTAAKATEAYSAELYTTALASEANTLTDMGVTLVEMSAEDFQTWWSAIMTSKATDALNSAAQMGTEAETETVLQVAADFTNSDVALDEIDVSAGDASGEPSGEPTGEPPAEAPAA